MTVLVEDVYTLLSTLAPAGGVWPMVNSAGAPAYPYIVFQRVVSVDNVALGGRSVMQNTRLQIDVYALSYLQADALATAIDSAFASWALWQNVPIAQQDLYEDSVKAFRISRDYSVWSTN